MNNYEEIEKRNHILINLINQAEQENSLDEAINYKKELYNNKLRMLDMIHEEDKRTGITAREFINNVDNMPVLPKFQTGIRPLDDSFNGGFQTGLFIQLAGESGSGKTTLILEILSNMSLGNKIVFFNFEMGVRLLSARLKKLLKTDKQLDNLVIDSDSRNLKDLIMEIELYAKDGVKFFAIDSKMKIIVDGNEDEHLKISRLSGELARLSQSRDITIMLINQMNEADIKNKRLAMKGSGDQKYDTDIALFYVKDEKGNRSLICTKNRQDEKEFSIDLKLDSNGKTVSTNEAIPSYEVTYDNDMDMVNGMF